MPMYGANGSGIFRRLGAGGNIGNDKLFPIALRLERPHSLGADVKHVDSERIAWRPSLIGRPARAIHALEHIDRVLRLVPFISAGFNVYRGLVRKHSTGCQNSQLSEDEHKPNGS